MTETRLSLPLIAGVAAAICTSVCALAWTCWTACPKHVSWDVPGHPGLTVRPLKPEDIRKAYFKLLSQLTSAQQVTEAQFKAQCRRVHRNKDHHVVVIESTKQKQVIASATLLVEHKFIRGCGAVGHIEDVVVSSAYRGRKLGQLLINHLVEVSRELGCYKVILDCNEKNVGFYERCGFEHKGAQMAQYF